MQEKVELDEVDRRILEHIQEDARASLESIATECDISPASVQRRLRKLREKRVILRDVAIVDADAVGQRMAFIVMVELERERLDELDAFTRTVKAHPQVQQCYYITGEADFCLICTARDMQDFELLTHQLFFENKNVRRFTTSVVMAKRKVGLTVPIEL